MKNRNSLLNVQEKVIRQVCTGFQVFTAVVFQIMSSYVFFFTPRSFLCSDVSEELAELV